EGDRLVWAGGKILTLVTCLLAASLAYMGAALAGAAARPVLFSSAEIDKVWLVTYLTTCAICSLGSGALGGAITETRVEIPLLLCLFLGLAVGAEYCWNWQWGFGDAALLDWEPLREWIQRRGALIATEAGPL
ncbi:hypothetical protein, partial [Streptomyces sp. NPDC005009]